LRRVSSRAEFSRKANICRSNRIHRERNRIARMTGHLTINLAVAARYDKLARSFPDALHLAAIRLRLEI